MSKCVFTPSDRRCVLHRDLTSCHFIQNFSYLGNKEAALHSHTHKHAIHPNTACVLPFERKECVYVCVLLL